jgi:DNA-binding CsgD family transcriptional regulator
VENSLANYYSELIQYNKKQLIELLNPIVHIHYVNFQRTGIYSKIPNLTRTFNYAEQNDLGKEIRNHFETFIYSLSKLCPEITPTEILICCLSFRFPTKKIALCLGYSSTNTIRQHKFRIRNKLTAISDHSFLFDFIFRNIEPKISAL